MGEGHWRKQMVWNIEMNEARNLYLGINYKVDFIDKIIQNFRMSYQGFKY